MLEWIQWLVNQRWRAILHWQGKTPHQPFER